MAEDLSIHPRVWLRGRVPEVAKKNTMKPRTAERRQRLLTALAEHCERHPKDGMSATRLAKLTAAA